MTSHASGREGASAVPSGSAVDVRIGARRVVTLWGPASSFVSLLRCMDGSTPRRRAVRWTLRAWQRTGALPLASHHLAGEALDEVERLSRPLREVAQLERLEVAAVAVFWPSHDRAHRRYLTAVDEGGDPLLFCKTSTAPAQDAHLLRREAAMLNRLQVDPLVGWRTPGLLALREACDRTDLILEAVPAQRRHLTWDEVLARLPLALPGREQGRVAGPPGWLEDARSLELDAGAARQVQALRSAPPRNALANADVRPANAVHTPAGDWLFDWEYASFEAPWGTDLVAATLNATVERRGAAVRVDELRTVLDEAAARTGLSTADLLNGLLYLATVAHPVARRLVRDTQW